MEYLIKSYCVLKYSSNVDYMELPRNHIGITWVKQKNDREITVPLPNFTYIPINQHIHGEFHVQSPKEQREYMPILSAVTHRLLVSQHGVCTHRPHNGSCYGGGRRRRRRVKGRRGTMISRPSCKLNTKERFRN